MRKKTKSRIRKKTLRHRINGSWLMTWYRSLGRLSKRAFWGVSVVFIFAASLWITDGYAAIAQKTTNGFYHTTAAIGFKVKTIAIEGRDITHIDSMKTLLASYKDTPLFAVDLTALKTTIETSIPWVHHARVERRLPSTLKITLNEIQPMARWRHKNKDYVVGEEQIIETSDIDAFDFLPQITGENAHKHASDFLLLLEAEPSISPYVKQADRVSDRRWNIEMTNGLLIKLPAENEEKALARLGKYHAEKNILNRNITEIDLRFNDRIIVKKGAIRPGIKPTSQNTAIQYN